jgi:hypothetical protein
MLLGYYELIETADTKHTRANIRYSPKYDEYLVTVLECGESNLYAGNECEYLTRDLSDAQDTMRMMMDTAEYCSAHYID